MVNPTDRASYFRNEKPAGIPSSATRVQEHVRMTHGPDGGALLDIRRGQMFHLNPAASRILELLKQGLGEQEIAAQIEREFGIEPVRAETDVREFLESLLKHDLVTSTMAAG